MIDHLSIGVADLDRSTAFYDGVLGKIGYVRVWATVSAAGYGSPGGNDKLALFVSPMARAPGAGFHLAFTAASEEAVKQFHAAGLQLGGTDAGAPGLRENYSPTYYAAFLFDPDGVKLEAVCQ
jgi:catechol 2,3-dioxygenase-like lactoylglutathione lyase family enzyme